MDYKTANISIPLGGCGKVCPSLTDALLCSIGATAMGKRVIQSDLLIEIGEGRGEVQSKVNVRVTPKLFVPSSVFLT